MESPWPFHCSTATICHCPINLEPPTGISVQADAQASAQGLAPRCNLLSTLCTHKLDQWMLGQRHPPPPCRSLQGAGWNGAGRWRSHGTHPSAVWGRADLSWAMRGAVWRRCAGSSCAGRRDACSESPGFRAASGAELAGLSAGWLAGLASISTPDAASGAGDAAAATRNRPS